MNEISLPAAPSPLALYIHWPWCLKKCPYCDFNSHATPNGAPVDDDMAERYLRAVMADMTLWQDQGITGNLVSIFFGGGTPSLMKPDQLARLISHAHKTWGVLPETEITVECNPTSSSKTLFSGLASAGVNRVSVGVQGLRDDDLSFLGREHNAAQALETLSHAVHAMDGHVNADVMYGLPYQKLGVWRDDLTRLAEMGISHLSAYQLTIEMQTAFYSQVARGLWHPLENDAQADFFEATQTILRERGFENYETSNFARPGHACRHNLHVWRYQPYIGVGAGAHGRALINGEWCATTRLKMPTKYMENIEEKAFWAGSSTPLTLPSTAQEAFMMGLRLAEGVNMEDIEKRFGRAACEDSLDFKALDRFVRLGMIRQSRTHVCLTSAGWGLLDSLLREILIAL
ncbi:MAG: coproporphyrinogen III oxidase [Alphaproteobacteria bacterium CG_4_10_14_0_8_um_filter_53_9]|nr:MAG: coproporphyrinogen III oxidase [Alphaproteobacteria bacterium CG_4_10_14_0_8_um_filter_53_9]